MIKFSEVFSLSPFLSNSYSFDVLPFDFFPLYSIQFRLSKERSDPIKPAWKSLKCGFEYHKFGSASMMGLHQCDQVGLFSVFWATLGALIFARTG